MDSSIIVAIITTTGATIAGWFNYKLGQDKIKLEKDKINLKDEIRRLTTPEKILFPDIQIESPRNGDLVSNSSKDVEGRIEGKIPPGYHLVVFHTRVDQGYWPQGKVTDIDGKRLTINSKRWKAKQFLNQKTTIKAALISSDVNVLFDYYHLCCREVFRKQNHFPGIPELPIEGVIYRDEVTVDIK